MFHEAEANFEVILLLMFMVAGIYFMKDLLLFVFTKILLNVRSKKMLAFLFSIVSAVLSAFLDALTVTAVLISVGVGFFAVFHRVASGAGLRIPATITPMTHAVQADRAKRSRSVSRISQKSVDAWRCGHRAGRRLHPCR